MDELEVREAKADLFNPQTVESVVKHETNDDNTHDLVPLTSTAWTFLVKRARHLYQLDHGRQSELHQNKLLKLLLNETEELINQISGFVRSSCDQIPVMDATEYVIVSDVVAQAVSLDKGTRLQVCLQLPQNVQEEVFSPFHLEKDPTNVMVKIQSNNFSCIHLSTMFQLSENRFITGLFRPTKLPLPATSSRNARPDFSDPTAK